MERTFTRTFLRRAAMTLLLAVMTMAATAETKIQGEVETCEAGAGYIHVSGWAFYAEDTDEAIDVRIMVYSDKSFDNQYRCGDLRLTTNMLSSEINDAYGISGNHGFNAYLFIGEGTYWVKVGAIYKSHTSRTIYPGEQSVTVAASGAMTLTDGAVLSGTGGADTHVTIADGATVTLMGVNITDIPNDLSHEWAGISCAGDATIILADGTTNSVKGGYADLPGIYVPVILDSYDLELKTLTIRGGGTLNASSNGWGAGIGGGNIVDCGNIVIEGGIINATGGNCAAGIGGGNQLSCGDITITTGITSLTATKGENAPYSIGAGYQGTCGTVNISGIETGGIEQSPYTMELVTVSFDANGGTGTMAAQTFLKGFEQNLNANTFTAPADMAFNCWNTEAGGTGTEYSNLESITVSGNTTLYAQWRSKTIDLTLIPPKYIGGLFSKPSFKAVWVSDGDILTGTASPYICINIDYGATVTLRNAHIAPTADYPAINLYGNTTIILEGYNYVKGGDKEVGCPGIKCLKGKTLTIRGNGSLEVRGTVLAAGIGGDINHPSGNIVIEGSVTSIAAYGDLAIGGNVLVSGTVTVASTLRDYSYDSGHTRILLNSSLPLSDASSNSYLLGLYNGQSNISATLQGRTLYKDGAWNTLCLPFAMTAQQVRAQLAPAALMTLGSSTFSGGTLTLNFEGATEIVAGQPYIIRWDKPDGYDGHEAEHDILSPTFTGVTVSKATAPVETQYVDFVGTTSPVTLAANDRSVLFLGSGNQLYWPSAAVPVNACRGYFRLNSGLEAGTAQARQFVLNFGEETGIVSVSKESGSQGVAGAWFSMDGVRLDAQPTRKGLYIHNGRKVVIK